MKSNTSKESNDVEKATKIFFRLGFISLILGTSYFILKPFLSTIVWGIIIAVAVYPFHKHVTTWMGGRPKLSAVIIAILGFSIIILPITLFGNSFIDSIKTVASSIGDEQLNFPLPNEKVKEWAIIGEPIYNFWEQLVNNLAEVLKNNREFLGNVAGKVTGLATSLVKSLVLMLASVIISAALLVFADKGQQVAHLIFNMVLDNRGSKMTKLSASTIRTVVQGILGTAIIQTFFLTLPLFLLDIPAAGFIAILILFLAVTQIPTIIVVLPLIIYVFTSEATLLAVLFLIWSVIWSASDNILKPMLIGNGAGVPMLVVLLGAIGGMLMAGPIGLFIGSVVLALAYNIVLALADEKNRDKTE